MQLEVLKITTSSGPAMSGRGGLDLLFLSYSKLLRKSRWIGVGLVGSSGSPLVPCLIFMEAIFSLVKAVPSLNMTLATSGPFGSLLMERAPSRLPFVQNWTEMV